MTTYKRGYFSCLADMVDHKPQGFSADAHTPIRLPNPIPHSRFTLVRGQRAVARRTIAYRSNHLSISFNTMAQVVGLLNTVRIISKLSSRD